MANNYTSSLRAEDLNEGDQLIDAIGPRWSDSRHSERVVQVVRKTSTRLVVAVVNADGKLTDRVLRVFVDKDGQVLSRVEGQDRLRGGSYLFTEDDPTLAAMRAHSDLVDLRVKAQQACERASHDMTRSKAEKAINAIQAYLDGCSK